LSPGPSAVPPFGRPQPARDPALRLLEEPFHARLQLQRRAPATLRHHVRRTTVRFLVLLAGDLVACGIMRSVVRVARDGSLATTSVAQWVNAVLPGGYLNGWGFAAALLVGLLVTGSYETGDHRRAPKRIFAAAALATALPLWGTIWTRGWPPVLLQYTLTVLLVWLGVMAERLAIDGLSRLVRHSGEGTAITLFVGSAEDCARVASSSAFASDSQYRAAGFVDVRTPAAPGALGWVGDLPVVVERSGAQAVVLCGTLSDAQCAEVVDVASAAGCQLLSVPRLVEVVGLDPTIVWRRGNAVIQLTEPALRWQQLLVKRAVDLTGAAIGLLVLSPVMLLVALAITLDSPGPVLFRQERIGAGGRRFRIFKFRTMQHGASDTSHRELVTRMLRGDEGGTAQVGRDGKPTFKLVDDVRVTRVGTWLRRRSLDELPQLVNVLRGEMSLVGPRPPVPYEVEQYEQWQFHRLQVRPGMTGLWQVSGRNRLSYRQMVELDLHYVREWSLWLDLSILLKTVPVVLSNSGGAQ